MNELDVFSEAIELATPAEQRRYLETVCAGNSTLRRRVEALLRSYEQAESFLEQPPVGHSPLDVHPQPECSEQLGDEIGPYRLLSVLGQGGMGIVYRAEQLAPIKRQVALKIIRPGMDSREVIARFEAERSALAILDHQNIAKVLDAGRTQQGLPYFVMELVPGTPITAFCDAHGLSLPRRMELFLLICRAIQHAHQKGIIHRDIKPTNLLVAWQMDEAVPKVIDFGIAKAIGEPLGDRGLRTSCLQVIGTPRYMSPEQAGLNSADIDTRSDVYSLGVVLYELLTGLTPFDEGALCAADFDEMRRQIRDSEPPTPVARMSQINGRELSALAAQRGLEVGRMRRILKGELSWIVMKAIAKEREYRYATPADLAADIDRYLHDLPVVARPTPWWMRLHKWRRRHPGWTALAATAACLLMVLAIGATWHTRQLSASLAVSERLQQEGRKREIVLRRELYANDMQRAAYLVSTRHLAQARETLERYLPRAGETDYRGLGWNYLWKLTTAPDRVLLGHDADILCADLSPNQELIASGDRDGTVRIWQLESGDELKTFRYAPQEITSVRFSPDGKFLATAGTDRTVRLWDVSDWTEMKVLKQHEKTVTCVAWSPDGSRLASSGRDHFVHIWNCAAGCVETTLPEHTDVVRCLAWSPDGKWLATADINRGVLLWETEQWESCGILACRNSEGEPNGQLAIAFSADSHVLATGGYGGTVRIAEVPGLREITSREAVTQIWSLGFIDHSCLAVGGPGEFGLLEISYRDKNAHWIRGIAAAGTVRAAIPAHGGERLVTAHEGGKAIKVWDTELLLGRHQTRLVQHPIAISPREDVVACVKGSGKYLAICRLDHSLVARFRCEYQAGCGATFSGDGRFLAFQIPDAERTVAVVDTSTWQIVQQLTPPATRLLHLAFSHDGQWLAAGGQHCVIGAWNRQTGVWQELLPPNPNIAGERWQTSIAFSPTETLLAATRWDGKEITLWRPDRGELCRLQSDVQMHGLAFSPDGEKLVAASAGVVSLWDLHRREVEEKLVSPVEQRNVTTLGATDSGGTPYLLERRDPIVDVTQFAFSPDGRTLASVTQCDNAVRLWDVPSRREMLSIPLPTNHFFFVTFRSRGQLAVGHWPYTVSWFDPPGRP